ncbi:MAG: hypothetical protein ACQKBV_05340 [Puniceicoccales bacterium]
MKRHLLWVLALLSAAPFAHAQSDDDSGKNADVKLRETIPTQSDPIAEQLIETYFKALGGRDRYLQLRNIKVVEHVKMGRNNFTQTIYYGWPDKVRIETIKREGGKELKVIEGYDGEEAWVYDLTVEHPFPKNLGGKRTKELVEMANVHGPLANWKERGYTAEYIGPVNSRRFKNYVVKLYDENGVPEFYYFDAKNYLLTRYGWRELRDDIVIDNDVFYVKYEKIRGLYLPVKVELAIEGQTYGVIEQQSIAFDQSFAPGFFSMPKVREVWLRGE